MTAQTLAAHRIALLGNPNCGMMTARLATAPRPQGAQADALRNGRARVGPGDCA
jgi:hypothetical protein